MKEKTTAKKKQLENKSQWVRQRKESTKNQKQPKRTKAKISKAFIINSTISRRKRKEEKVAAKAHLKEPASNHKSNNIKHTTSNQKRNQNHSLFHKITDSKFYGKNQSVCASFWNLESRSDFGNENADRRHFFALITEKNQTAGYNFCWVPFCMILTLMTENIFPLIDFRFRVACSVAS